MTLGELKEQIDQILAQRPAAALSVVFVSVFDTYGDEDEPVVSTAGDVGEPTPTTFVIRGEP